MGNAMNYGFSVLTTAEPQQRKAPQPIGSYYFLLPPPPLSSDDESDDESDDVHM